MRKSHVHFNDVLIHMLRITTWMRTPTISYLKNFKWVNRKIHSLFTKLPFFFFMEYFSQWKKKEKKKKRKKKVNNQIHCTIQMSKSNVEVCSFIGCFNWTKILSQWWLISPENNPFFGFYFASYPHPKHHNQVIIKAKECGQWPSITT